MKLNANKDVGSEGRREDQEVGGFVFLSFFFYSSLIETFFRRWTLLERSRRRRRRRSKKTKRCLREHGRRINLFFCLLFLPSLFAVTYPHHQHQSMFTSLLLMSFMHSSNSTRRRGQSRRNRALRNTEAFDSDRGEGTFFFFLFWQARAERKMAGKSFFCCIFPPSFPPFIARSGLQKYLPFFFILLTAMHLSSTNNITCVWQNRK